MLCLYERRWGGLNGMAEGENRQRGAGKATCSLRGDGPGLCVLVGIYLRAAQCTWHQTVDLVNSETCTFINYT
jgi:hypothetical protein